MEDVISGVRRTRHLYKVIDELTKRVSELETLVLTKVV